MLIVSNTTHGSIIFFLFCFLFVGSQVYVQSNTWMDEQPTIESRFSLGIASGHPSRTSIWLWTWTNSTQYPCIYYFLSDVGFPSRSHVNRQVFLKQGRSCTSQEQDGTHHVSLTGLSPDTFYSFWFYTDPSISTSSLPPSSSNQPDFTFLPLDVSDGYSDIGYFRTLPQAPRLINIAFVTCTNFETGPYYSYKYLVDKITRNELLVDIVVHLGDVIYEHSNSGFYDLINDQDNSATRYPSYRSLRPSYTLKTLNDYRERHRQTKSDVHFQELSKLTPWIYLWNDHEVSDNYSKNSSTFYPFNLLQKDTSLQQELQSLIQNGQRAYMEYRPGNLSDPYLYNVVEMSEDVVLINLDTRGQRFQPDMYNSYILSPEQEAWFVQTMNKYPNQWKIISNGVPFAPISFEMARSNFEVTNPMIDAFVRDEYGQGTMSDSWVGYPYQHSRILYHWRNQKWKNAVIMTGDAHLASVRDIKLGSSAFTVVDFSQNDPLTFEFITPAVSSPSADKMYSSESNGLIQMEKWLQDKSIHVTDSYYYNTRLHGFMLLSAQTVNDPVQVRLIKTDDDDDTYRYTLDDTKCWTITRTGIKNTLTVGCM